MVAQESMSVSIQPKWWHKRACLSPYSLNGGIREHSYFRTTLITRTGAYLFPYSPDESHKRTWLFLVQSWWKVQESMAVSIQPRWKVQGSIAVSKHPDERTRVHFSFHINSMDRTRKPCSLHTTLINHTKEPYNFPASLIDHTWERYRSVPIILVIG